MMEEHGQRAEILRVVGVTKTFLSGGRSIEVLRGVDLYLNAGESLSIRGESGSGKTTLLNIVAGLEAADQGAVIWRGRETAELSTSERAKVRTEYLGMVFQAFYLIPELNTFENVLFACRVRGRVRPADRERARTLLSRVGLGEREKSSVNQLSGGERQRVALARALVIGPALILADEPTGNLDERTADVVIALLLEVCREANAGLILVTHNAGFAEMTDRAGRLHMGRME